MQVQNLFFSADAEKQTLHRRITPNAEQVKEQQERWNNLRDFLVDKLGEEIGYQISSWLQGSYKFGTQTRPAQKGAEFDIDLGIYFEWSGRHDIGKYTPKQLRDFVQEKLQVYTGEIIEEAKVADPKERCLRIKFPGDFHIDIPCYHLDRSRDARMLATETNGWEDSDPKAIHKWFQEAFTEEENTQVRRLIRYFKVWAQLNMEPAPSSILLTVLVSEAYQTLGEAELQTDDLALYYITHAIYNRLGNSLEVANPANPYEDLNRFSDKENEIFISKLKEFAGLAEKALLVQSIRETVSIWSKAFRHFFPIPPEIETNDQRSLVVQNYIPEVFVEARTKIGSKERKAFGNNAIKGVPLNCDIFFSISNRTQFPKGISIQWTVRNEGGDAESQNDLGHLAGTNWTAQESSAYLGTHYMDIEVFAFTGNVIGFRRIPVEIRGIIPVRNPRKEAWTKLYRKKR